MIEQDPIFIYDKKDSIENNYQRWFRWNRREREKYNEQPYSDFQARTLFEKLYIK
tara:strand:- start:50 stop:214 length:165 start_codon:yes stop_codon:yes gene_type:complete